MMHKIRFALAISVLSTLLCSSGAFAGDEPSEMDIGMQCYKTHDYLGAMGHFGSALSNEFNSANLHYHMANCMVHLHEKDGAIREYRIAYALQPHGKIGNYCKQCLHLFGIDAEGKIIAKTDTEKDKDKEKDEKAKEEAKKNEGLASVSKFIDAGDKTALNLDDLVKQKPRAGSAQLQRVGTNMFVRNYKDPQIATAAHSEQSKKVSEAVKKNSK